MHAYKKSFLSIFFILFISIIYLLAFSSSFAKKGSFSVDEPAIVSSSLNPNRRLVTIFKDAASIAQPPLEHIIREKIYQPIGVNLGLSKPYPELFHRALSLLWWLLPILYFSLNLKNYSKRTTHIIFLFFLLICSSEFFRFYLSEARHYSAIAATFATMIIVLLVDKVPIHKMRYHFLLISLLPPLLHIISFPYYIVFIIYFFYRLIKESNAKNKVYIFDMATLFLIYLSFIVWIYYWISELSSSWQNPDINNINLGYINSRIKWTLDWILYGSPFYVVFKNIPGIIKSNLVLIFFAASFLYANYLRKILFSRKYISDIITIFPLIILLVWPLTIAAVIFRSGMFSGERYSIVILLLTYFWLSSLIIKQIWKVKNINHRYIYLSITTLVLLIIIIHGILPIPNVLSESAENRFVKENISVISNPNNVLIADNGGYSSSISMLSILNNIPFKTNFVACRWETFFSVNGQNTLNDWLRDHAKDSVYFLSTGKPLTGNVEIVWKYDILTLYLVKSIDQQNLCDKIESQTIGECYTRCTRGHEPSPDKRSILGVTPHVDITRE